jgi:type VI secretion system secreted protein VgrG
MAIGTKTSIQIEGETLNRFSKLSITQQANAHHQFTIWQPLPREFINQAIEKSQGYIGKSIKIDIKPNISKTEAPLVFYGIIKTAKLVRENGSAGMILITGFSPTIAMENLPNSKSFTDKSLSDIIQEIINPYPQRQLKPTINLRENETLAYTVQYNESDFGFLSRMAQKKAAWFYYNGEQLVFGKPQSKTFTLEYGRSLERFDIEMNAKPIHFQYTGYDPSTGETQKVSASEINHQTQGYAKQVLESSKKMFPAQSTMLYSNAMQEGNAHTHLVDRLSTQLQSQTANLITATGISDETGLRIGDVVAIHESAFSMTGNPQDGVQEQNYGSYTITHITHSCEEGGQYTNTFQAIPESALCPAYGNVLAVPTASTQPATVVDNNDPAGLGRIKVQFAWQDGDTPWLRMTNPHAGGGKGMYFVPEIGEEVLIAFENDNAEKPFVLGSMYNGNESSGYASGGNDNKVIQTRSGCKILINDAVGSIFLEDPSGNTWMMDGNGNISVNAPKNFTVSAGENVNITAGKNVSVSAGGDMDNSAGKNITQTAGNDLNQSAQGNFIETSNNRTEIVEKDFKRQADTSNEVATSVAVFSQKDTMTLQSGKAIQINSAERTNQF